MTTCSPLPSRLRRALVGAGALLLATTATAAGPTSAAAGVDTDQTTLSLPAGLRILAERTEFSGTAPGDVARSVRIETKTGKPGDDSRPWTEIETLTTDSDGGWATTVDMPDAPGWSRWRAVAVRVRGAAPLAPSASPVRYRYVRRQAARLVGPTTVEEGTTARLTARFAPARPGRVVRIQELREGRWTALVTGAQNAAGRLRTRVANDTAGTRTLRAVTVADRGAAAAISPSRTLTVSPPTGPLTGTTRVSVATDGTQGDGASVEPDISGDGRYVAFESQASGLVPGDTNGRGDVFVRDTETDELTRVSVATDGTQGDNHSSAATISDDGRYVSFLSYATTLVPGDTNGAGDAFVHDTLTGETTRVSVATDGGEANSYTNRPAIDGEGRYVTFESNASDLVAGDGNGTLDVFVHDTVEGDTTLVSVATDGTQGSSTSFEPAISGDGRHVSFTSDADDLVADDTSGSYDVFVHDTVDGVTTRVSVDTDDAQADGNSFESTISDDGSRVAFRSVASDLVPGDTNSADDVFVRDTATGVTTRVSVAGDGTDADGDSSEPAISGDGRHVSFDSDATNLTDDDMNGASGVFVTDTATAVTDLVTRGRDGLPAVTFDGLSALSGDGRFVAFQSQSDELVADDTNETLDVFVHDRDQE